ncbi:MAG: MCP four helix bundle domain-containing protein [Phycisphaerales bacterium]|nr:MCP four helix bundle domain-containing protein [Phycisphaerales bacterium]
MTTGKTMTIGRKLMAAFLLVSVITAALGGIGYYAVAKGAADIDEIGEVRLPSVDSLLQLAHHAESIRGAMRTLGIPGLPPEMRERQYKSAAEEAEACQAAWKVYEALPQTDEEAPVWRQFVPAWETWAAEREKYLEICHRFDKNGIADPAELAKLLERFTKDHHVLAKKVLHRLFLEDSAFEGGEDHTACNAGKWLPTFSSNNPQLTDLVRNFEVAHRKFHQSVAKIKRQADDGELEQAQAAYRQETVPAMEEVFKQFGDMLAIANDSAAIMQEARQQLLGPVAQAYLATDELLDKLVQINRNIATTRTREGQNQAVMFETVALVTSIAGVVAALSLGMLITRGINRNLSRLASQLDDGANQVTDASRQVASASQQLAAGASQQASSLEETSSALEQMAAMTRTNAANAEKANELAGQARKSADQGEQTMGELNTAMTAINESAAQIGKIIKVIEEIAFQTNLLALNAAVEAARAGEMGKGFAVVAEEVRNLAQRSAQAARDTTNLIEGAVTRAKQGTTVATNAGKSLSSIVADVANVAELLAGISKASGEQAQGVDQINTAVSQMDKVTQQNAAGAEESASAAEQLSAQAQTLKQVVDELTVLVRGATGDASASGSSSQGTRPRANRSAARNAPARAAASQPAHTPAAHDDFNFGQDFAAGSNDTDANLKQF